MLSNSFTFSIQFKQDIIKPWHIQWPTSDISVRQPSFKQEVHVQRLARFRNVYKNIKSTQMVNCYNGSNWDWSKINNYNIL